MEMFFSPSLGRPGGDSSHIKHVFGWVLQDTYQPGLASGTQACLCAGIGRGQGWRRNGRTLSLSTIFDCYGRGTVAGMCVHKSKLGPMKVKRKVLNRDFMIISSHFSPEFSALLSGLIIAFWKRTLKWVLLLKISYDRSTSFMTAISQ